MRRTLFAVIGFVGIVGVVLADAEAALLPTTLDGVWEGSLNTAQGSGLTPLTKPMVVRIVISGAKAQVSTQRANGKMEEVKPGRFHVTRVKSNAIVAAIDSGKDQDGTWVETWDFAVMLKDQDTLITTWSRMVNNIDLPLSVKYSKFSVATTGELHRVR